MSERTWWIDELETISRQRQTSEERRAHRQRMNRGADVVSESSQSQRAGPRPATDLIVRLEYANTLARLCQNNAGRESIRSRSNNHCIQVCAHIRVISHKSLLRFCAFCAFSWLIFRDSRQTQSSSRQTRVQMLAQHI